MDFELNIHGSGFNKAGDPSQVKCNYWLNETTHFCEFLYIKLNEYTFLEIIFLFLNNRKSKSLLLLCNNENITFKHISSG